MWRRVAVSLAALLVIPTAVAANAGTPRSYVGVLDAAGLQPVGTPTGLTPAWIVAALRAGGVPARTVTPAAIPAGAVALVNPYGEAFPDTPAVESATAHGVAWVNLAGVPFLAPNGTADPAAPARFGVFCPPTPAEWFTGTKVSTLGAALLPGWPSRTSDHLGVVIHGKTPAVERPLADYADAAGVDGGPAVSLILAPDRIVAVGLTGDTSPLAPDRPGSAALLTQLVQLAAHKAATIQSVSVTRVGRDLDVTAR